MYNDKLNSREGAAELLGVSVSSLADYELGNTKVVPVDKVVLMADLYNAPEIKNFYCANECPIGCGTVKQLEVSELERLTVRLLSSFQQVSTIQNKMISISSDGKVQPDEVRDFNEVIQHLDYIMTCAQELKLYAEKNVGKEGS